jgi:predicted metal-dependent hydrolase
VVTMSYPLDHPERARDVRARLVGWYRDHAGARLDERASYWSEKLRVRPPGCATSGSRAAVGKLRRLGRPPLQLANHSGPAHPVDYVVVRELVHLQHRSHSSEFWEAVGKVVPDYDTLRSRLRMLGPTLVW